MPLSGAEHVKHSPHKSIPLNFICRCGFTPSIKQEHIMPTRLTYEERKAKFAWHQFYKKCDEMSGLWDMIDKLNLSKKQEMRMWLELDSQGYSAAIIYAYHIIKKQRLRTLFNAWKGVVNEQTWDPHEYGQCENCGVSMTEDDSLNGEGCCEACNTYG